MKTYKYVVDLESSNIQIHSYHIRMFFKKKKFNYVFLKENTKHMYKKIYIYLYGRSII